MGDRIGFVSAEVGALSNGTCAIFKVPTGYGGVRIIGAQYVDSGAGTSWLSVGAGGTAGTAVVTTIAAGGTVVNSANVPNILALTAANCYVAEGHNVVVKENNIGALGTRCLVEVSFLYGK